MVRVLDLFDEVSGAVVDLISQPLSHLAGMHVVCVHASTPLAQRNGASVQEPTAKCAPRVLLSRRPFSLLEPALLDLSFREFSLLAFPLLELSPLELFLPGLSVLDLSVLVFALLRETRSMSSRPGAGWHRMVLINGEFSLADITYQACAYGVSNSTRVLRYSRPHTHHNRYQTSAAVATGSGVLAALSALK